MPDQEREDDLAAAIEAACETVVAEWEGRDPSTSDLERHVEIVEEMGVQVYSQVVSEPGQVVHQTWTLSRESDGLQLTWRTMGDGRDPFDRHAYVWRELRKLQLLEEAGVDLRELSPKS